MRTIAFEALEVPAHRGIPAFDRPLPDAAEPIDSEGIVERIVRLSIRLVAVNAFSRSRATRRSTAEAKRARSAQGVRDDISKDDIDPPARLVQAHRVAKLSASPEARTRSRSKASASAPDKGDCVKRRARRHDSRSCARIERSSARGWHEDRQRDFRRSMIFSGETSDIRKRPLVAVRLPSTPSKPMRIADAISRQ